MKDLLLNNEGDLQIKAADLVIGTSNRQHQEALIITQPGSFFETPDVGVGAEDFLNSNEEDNPLAAVVREQFTKDGQVVISISFNSQTGDLVYDADYNN